MTTRRGISVESVSHGSPGHKAGIATGDTILSINGMKLNDGIDYMFQRAGPVLDIEIDRGGKRHSFKLTLKEAEDPGIELKPFRVKTCRNNCIFCFVGQLPNGLRKSLYVRDDDYRMSFLYGNYITMTNLTEGDKERIVRQRLNPLYISVHSTNQQLRGRMLGNPTAPDIMKELEFLKENRIKMHAQVVLCPGINDGAELKRTLGDLQSLYPYLVSIAVVPVGLTDHRKPGLRPVGKDDAEKALKTIEGFQKRFRRKHGDPYIYGADELYIKAERPFPHIKDYGDLPQLENGVGPVSLFSSLVRQIKLQMSGDELHITLTDKPPLSVKRQRLLRYVAFTGMAFYPYLEKFIDRLRKSGIDISLVPVENHFFGRSVTVTGLLTGRDIIKTLSEKTEGRDMLFIPAPALRQEGDIFLDDLHYEDVGRTLGIKTKVVEPTPEGLIRGIITSVEEQ